MEQKFGRDVAESFLVCQEEIESMEWLNTVVESSDGTKKFTKAELQEIVELLGIIRCGDKEQSIDEYEQYKKRKHRENQEKRERIRSTNQSLIQKVHDLGIWFPYPKDKGKWEANPHIGERAVFFFELVKQVKERMRKQRCLLQYINKRRLTGKTILDLERNLDAMNAYLMCTHA